MRIYLNDFGVSFLHIRPDLHASILFIRSEKSRCQLHSHCYYSPILAQNALDSKTTSKNPWICCQMKVQIDEAANISWWCGNRTFGVELFFVVISHFKTWIPIVQMCFPKSMFFHAVCNITTVSTAFSSQ